MSDRNDYSSASSSSARVRKRQRQKVNQHKRATDHDALVIFRNRPTLANAFRAWLVQLRSLSSMHEHRSAEKFAYAFQTFTIKTFGSSNFIEYQPISIDSLIRNVENFAWSLNVETTLKGDEGRPRSSTSRVACNFRSFLIFLGTQGLFTQPDMAYLLEACESLREDLERTAKVNRIMEEYVSHIQEIHYSVHYPADQIYWCEYEIEKICSRKLIFLRRIGNNNENRSNTCLTRIPGVLSNVIRVGDIFTAQLCYMEDKRVWVPYMYSGFTPTHEDGEVTPKGDRGKRARTPAGRASDNTTRRSQDNDISSLSRELARVQLMASPTHQSRARRRSNVAENYMAQESWNDAFDEAHFTEEYFRSWEGDIGSDDEALKN